MGVFNANNSIGTVSKRNYSKTKYFYNYYKELL